MWLKITDSCVLVLCISSIPLTYYNEIQHLCPVSRVAKHIRCARKVKIVRLFTELNNISKKIQIWNV